MVQDVRSTSNSERGDEMAGQMARWQLFDCLEAKDTLQMPAVGVCRGLSLAMRRPGRGQLRWTVHDRGDLHQGEARVVKKPREPTTPVGRSHKVRHDSQTVQRAEQDRGTQRDDRIDSVVERDDELPARTDRPGELDSRSANLRMRFEVVERGVRDYGVQARVWEWQREHACHLGIKIRIALRGGTNGSRRDIDADDGFGAGSELRIQSSTHRFIEQVRLQDGGLSGTKPPLQKPAVDGIAMCSPQPVRERRRPAFDDVVPIRPAWCLALWVCTGWSRLDGAKATAAWPEKRAAPRVETQHRGWRRSAATPAAQAVNPSVNIGLTLAQSRASARWPEMRTASAARRNPGVAAINGQRLKRA